MRYILLIALSVISLLTLSCEEKALYETLSENEYRSLKAQDTIIKTPGLLVTCTGNAGHYNDMETILVNKRDNYYKLATDVYFEDNTTLIEFQGFFSSGGDTGPFQENGTWVYTDFYKDTFHNGSRHAVDSIPPGYNDSNRPKKEGIYFYENKQLKRIAAGQSDEEFKEFGKDGFYFIPNSGRFFKRHSVNLLD